MRGVSKKRSAERTFKPGTYLPLRTERDDLVYIITFQTRMLFWLETLLRLLNTSLIAVCNNRQNLLKLLDGLFCLQAKCLFRNVSLVWKTAETIRLEMILVANLVT